MPDAIELSEPFARAYLAEPARQVEGAACLVGGHDLRLERPVAFGLRLGGESHQERSPDATAVDFAIDVNADLSDPGGASSIGDGR